MNIQPELFQIREERHGTFYESRLAHGTENTTGLISRPPMPAPATSLPPFARNSNTSREAAISKYEGFTCGNQREVIYQLLKSCGTNGATREALEQRLSKDRGMTGNTIRPRIKELLGESKGFTVARIRRNGETRKTKAGLNAEVLVAI